MVGSQWAVLELGYAVLVLSLGLRGGAGMAAAFFVAVTGDRNGFQNIIFQP